MNVQNCLITPGNSLVVHTWTGVVINIYLLPEQVKTRPFKRVLQEATDMGIGSLFIVDADLLPQPDSRFEPVEGLMALHAINHECIYAYDIDEKGPRLIQIHFEPVGSTGAYLAKYGPDVTFDELRYLKVSVKPRFIKGDWQIADFGFHPFWRDSQRTYKRTEYRRPDNRDHHWQAWSQTSWDQANTQDIPKPNIPIVSRLDQSYALLEVPPNATRDEVKVAFRKLALSVHPDTGNLPKDEAEAKFRAVSEAYEFIKEQRGW
jgi:hypothetical protein